MGLLVSFGFDFKLDFDDFLHFPRILDEPESQSVATIRTNMQRILLQHKKRKIFLCLHNVY